MSITVTVNGQSGPSIAVKTGDQVGVSVGASSSSYTVGVSPAGTPGGTGPVGPQGPPYTTISVDATTTLAASQNASVTPTSTNNGANLTLAFGIPAGPAGLQGPAGPAGPQGPAGTNGTSLTLSDATPAAPGTASAGTSSTVSRADHTHQLPVIAYGNLTGTPSNFPTNTTLVSGLSAGYSGINHAHNYVTSLNNLTGAVTLAAGANVTITPGESTLTIDAVGVGGSLDANAPIDGGTYVGSVIPVITITSQPSRQVISANGTVSFSVSAFVTHSATLSYQWEKQEALGGSFAAVAGATSSTLALSALTDQADGGDRYRVVISATGGAASVTSNSARIVAGAVDWTITGADYWPAYQSSMAATFAARTVSDSTSTAGLTPGGNVWYSSGVLLPSGDVLVIPYDTQYPTLYNVAANLAYNLSSSNWSIAPNLNNANPNGLFLGDGAVLLQDGRVFCLSRWPGASQIWNPATNTSTVVSALNQYRQYSGCVLLSDGRVFLMPYVANDSPNSPAKAAGLFDPSTGTVSATSATFPSINPPFGSLGSDGTYRGACLLPDGRVYVVPALAGQARLYDPQAGAVSVASGSFADAVVGTLLLSDGRVLVVEHGASVRSLRIYNPDTNSLSSSIATGNFNKLSLLPNGKVLITTTNSAPLLFDTASQATTSSSVASVGYAYNVPLLDGRVLLLRPNSQALLYGGGGGFDQNVSLSAYYNQARL